MNALTPAVAALSGCVSLESLSRWEAAVGRHIDTLSDELTQTRRQLHRNPELSGKEHQTTQYLMGILQQHQLEPRTGPRDVGLTLDIDVGAVQPSSPLIALRGDIDALPITDQKTCPYTSQIEGVMHACGHDAHATMLLGAALTAGGLSQDEAAPDAEHAFRLRFIFQPAEEICAGADWMIGHGCLEGVDAILALHVDPSLNAGHIGVRYGALTASCDDLTIQIQGRGGHAARPHNTADPVAAAALIISTLYQVIPRATDVRQPSVITIGQVQAGHSPNVIPDAATLRGTLRVTDDMTQETLRHRIREVVQGVAVAAGVEAEVTFTDPLGGVMNDPTVTAAIELAARTLLTDDQVKVLTAPSMGGEDFSFYLDHVPGSMLRLGSSADPHNAPGLHSPLFDIDESILATGPRILLGSAMITAAAARSGLLTGSQSA